jgi:hypothetical protein
MKTMTARYAGKCAECGASFEAGTTIAYNGEARHPACVEAAKAAQEADDREACARFARDAADFKAGKFVKVIPGDGWLRIEGAPSYEWAKMEARATVASIVAAGGVAKLLKHKRGGKWYLGKELVSYYGGSNLGHHEGWAFKWECPAPAQAVAS